MTEAEAATRDDLAQALGEARLKIKRLEETLDKIATWFEAQAARNEAAAKTDRFKYVADARIFDAKNYRAMAKDARKACAVLSKQEGGT